MLNCSLSKNKSYQVQNILFNPTEKSYQLTLTEKPTNCESGIFNSKKLELKVVSDNQIPYLHFNKQDGVPELVLNNLSLVRSTTHIQTTKKAENPIVNHHNAQYSTPNYSFLYIILGVVVFVLLIRYFMKKNQENNQSYLNTQAPNQQLNNYNTPFNTSNSPYENTSQNYNQQNYGQTSYDQPNQQGPSKTASFLTGLAGGAVGAVVANEIYDKLKGNEAHAQQTTPPPTPMNNNDSFSSDGYSSFSDDSDDDTFSSDY
jgi:hypothetical protein